MRALRAVRATCACTRLLECVRRVGPNVLGRRKKQKRNRVELRLEKASFDAKQLGFPQFLFRGRSDARSYPRSRPRNHAVTPTFSFAFIITSH
eukprot:3277078-Pleurochrysis_carterae.AAC.1